MNLILQAIKSLFRKIEIERVSDNATLSKQIDAVESVANNAQTIANTALNEADATKKAVDLNFYVVNTFRTRDVSNLNVGGTLTSQITTEKEFKLARPDTGEYLDTSELVAAINRRTGKSIKIECGFTDSGYVGKFVNVSNAYVVDNNTYNYKMYGLVVSDTKVLTVAMVCENDAATLTVTRIM